MKKTFLLSMLALGLGSFAASAQAQMDFSYASPEAQRKCWGTDKAETYDVAIRFDDASLKGMKVKSISVPMPCASATDCSGWITRELKTETIDGKKVNVVDVTAKATIADRTLTAVFDEPYLIQGAFYVGYSISVPKILEDDEYTGKPIVYTSEVNPDGFYLRTSRTHRSWSSCTTSIDAKGMTSALKVVIDGNFADNSVGIASFPNSYARAGEEMSLPITLINHGSTQITEFDYTYDFNGRKGEGHRVLDTPLPPQFNGTVRTSVTLPAESALGRYECSVTITKVNGVANNDPAPTATAFINVTDVVPVMRPLFEEFTGTTCGWCPFGFVAMERLAEMHGDDFVGLAYHCYTWDPMCMRNQYPGMVNALPSMRVNREIAPDSPYFGFGNDPMGINDIWEEQAAEMPLAAISVSADWVDEDKTKIEATSWLSWATLPEDMDASKYRIQYVLVADGLTDPSWGQTNYLADKTQYAGMPGLDEFVYGAATVYGLVYNDVPVLTSADNHNGVPKSVDNIELYKANSHSYTFDINNALNYSGKPIIQDKDKLKVVAFLLYMGAGCPYPTYGKVLNACKARLGETGAVGNLLNGDARPVAEAWYDLNGRLVANPDRGLYIQMVRYSDGSVRTQKIMR